MEATGTTVDWHLYAEKYDMLLEYNPFYQQLRREIFAQIDTWQIEAGDLIADIGAGTGNYSIGMAQKFPHARVLHVDNNAGMNDRALGKKQVALLKNIDIFNKAAEELNFQTNSFKAILSVHALYTFPDPQEILARMYNWLEPGGRAILVDPGRIVNVLNWQLAIAWHLISRHGLRQTLRIFKEARIVSEQNRSIRELQREGILWTHSHEEYCAAVEAAGFQILEARTCFRGLSDMVILSKT